MDNIKKNPQLTLLFFIGIIMAAVGIIMAVISGISVVMTTGSSANYQSVQGTIDHSEMISTDRGIEYGDVYAKYEVNGVTYKSRIYDYPDPPVTGSIVKVYYDPSNPEKTRPLEASAGLNAGSLFVNLLLALFGVILIIAAYALRNARTDEEQRVRYKSYEEYGGEQTERAGTLFDKEVSYEETKFDLEHLPARMRTRGASKFRKFFGLGEYDHY